MVRSKYSRNIQNPASLTWLAANDPAPIASTIKAGWIPALCIRGNTSPEAVMAATVAEPRAIRKTTAINQPRISGEMDDETNRFFHGVANAAIN